MNIDMRPAWRNYWISLGFATILLLSFIASPASGAGTNWAAFWIAGVFIGIAALRRFAARYTVAGDRIQAHEGIIARTQRSVKISHLRNVNLRQSVVQRLLNVGDVEFSTAGGGGIEVVFRGIIDPAGLRDQFESLTD